MRINTMPWDKDFDADAFQKECQQSRAKHSLRGMKANNAGQLFEKQIEAACESYRLEGLAYITKIPEPFRVLRKLPAGRANVQFMRHAEPDFMGTLSDGRSIVFEAKYTVGDKINCGVLTARQFEVLDACCKLGAKVGVCCCVLDKCYFVPWEVFGYMRALFGHAHMKAEELKPYEVFYNGVQVNFLDYKDLWQANEGLRLAREKRLESETSE